MNGGVTIRKAVLRDVETIANYNIQMAMETEDKKLDKKVVLKGVKAVIKDPRKGFYLLAEKKDAIFGQLMITFEWSDWRNKCFWWIQSVYVDRRYRNQKIFTSLYREIMRLAISTDDVCGLRLYVEEHNESAKKVYKKLDLRRTSYEMFEMLF